MSKFIVLILTAFTVLTGCAHSPPPPAPVEDQQVEEQKPESKLEVVVDKDGWETPAGEEPSADPLPVAFTPWPPGYGPKDIYSSHDEACLGTVRARVPEDKPMWRRAILDFCEDKSFNASRGQVIVSKVDGSWTHDRDRATAWKFYARAVLNGWLDPEGCPYHVVERKARYAGKSKHPPKCNHLRRHWPYKNPRMTEKLSAEWRTHPHDMERFGAIGPHDWNANAFKYTKGCWDPAQLARYDVSIGTTVDAAIFICENWGCRTKRDIKAHFGRNATPPPQR